MIESRTMETEAPSEYLHVALVGPESNGKSTLGSTAPGVKLFLDYDQKAQVLAGKKDVYCLTIKNAGPSFTIQGAAEEVLDIMSGLEASLDLYNLKDTKGTKLFPHVPEGTIVQNLFHDSMASLGKLFLDYELSSNGDLRRELKVGKALTIYIPKNFDSWNAEMKAVESIVMRSFALPVNVFCLFHERAEEAADSSIEKPKYTGRVSLYPVRYKDLLLKYFTDIWRVKLTYVNGGYLPRVYTKPDFSHDNGSSLLVDPIEEPNIAAMIAKHKKAKGIVSQTQVSTPQGQNVVAGLAVTKK